MSSIATVSRRDLRWALKAVLPHVSDDDTLPHLAAVHIGTDPAAKALWCVATDRYTIGVARVAAGIEGDAASAELHRPDVKEIRRRLKGGGDTAVVEIGQDGFCLDSFHRWHPVGSGLEYPDWRNLLAKPLHQQPSLPSGDIGYCAAYLARFKAADREKRRGGGLIYLPFAAIKRDGGMFFVLAENFLGAVMGRTECPDIGEMTERWRGALPLKEPAKEGAR